MLCDNDIQIFKLLLVLMPAIAALLYLSVRVALYGDLPKGCTADVWNSCDREASDDDSEDDGYDDRASGSDDDDDDGEDDADGDVEEDDDEDDEGGDDARGSDGSDSGDDDRYADNGQHRGRRRRSPVRVRRSTRASLSRDDGGHRSAKKKRRVSQSDRDLESGTSRRSDHRRNR